MVVRVVVETILPADCPVCRLPLGEHIGGVCLACWRELRPWPGEPWLGAVAIAGAYEGPLRKIIRCLKFSGMSGLAEPLGCRLAERLAARVDQFDLVMPVPLHRLRRWRRGYNQSELIARSVARSLGRPLATGILTRRRATASQRGRTRAGRAANVRGAFRASHGALKDLKETRILVVDDVVTTGATLAECARALAGAGAAQVLTAAVAGTVSRIES